jgi:hypothetical protein
MELVLPLPETLSPASLRMRSEEGLMRPAREVMPPTSQRMQPGPRPEEFSPLPEA